MKIETLTGRNMPEFLRIWRQTFGDSDEMILEFLNSFREDLETFMITEEGVVRSILTQFLMGDLMIPGKNGQISYPVLVSYAIATDPDFREKGSGSVLTAFARDRAVSNGAVSLLSPASNELVAFYEPLGYVPLFPVRERPFRRSRLPLSFSEQTGQEDRRIKRISASDYQALREKLLEDTVHIRLSEKALAYEKRCCRDGGFFLLNEMMICTLEKSPEGKMYIPELIYPKGLRQQELDAGLSGLLLFCGQEEILYRTPAVPEEKETYVQGMIARDSIDQETIPLLSSCFTQKADGFAPYFGFTFG